MERALIALLAGIFGFVLGLFAPAFVPAAQDARSAEQIFLDVATSVPAATRTPVGIAGVPRLQAVPTQNVPTLTPPAPRPTPLPTIAPVPEYPNAPPPAQTFRIKLQGGGEMNTVASDRQAAINNVKSTGATPAEEP